MWVGNVCAWSEEGSLPWVSGALSSGHPLHSPSPGNPLAHRVSGAQSCPCGSPCAAQAGQGTRGAGGLGCRRLGQKCWLSLLVQRCWLWQEDSCQQGREARAPAAGGDHHSPLKLDQSEKSEVLRGSGSGLTTSSIWRKEPVSAAAQCCPHSLTWPKTDGQTDRGTLTRGRPSPARAQLTVVSFSLSTEATGPTRLLGGKMGPLQLGHW